MPGRRPAPAWGRGPSPAHRPKRPRRSTSAAPPAKQPPTPVRFRRSVLRHRGGRRHTSQAQHEHTPRKVSHTAPLMPSNPPRARGVSVSGADGPVRRQRSMCVLGEVRVSQRRRAPCYPRPAGQDARQTVFLPATGLLRSGPSNARGEAPAFLLKTSRTANSREYLHAAIPSSRARSIAGSFGRPRARLLRREGEGCLGAMANRSCDFSCGPSQGGASVWQLPAPSARCALLYRLATAQRPGSRGRPSRGRRAPRPRQLRRHGCR